MNLPDNFVAIPSITILCYLFGELYKSLVSETLYKHIPALCAALGVLLSVLSFYTLPGYIPAENWLVAGSIGAVSGWAATGVHQIIKQEGHKNE
ncbi:phage holin family protein [Oscillospiraceae bacterium MB08-C2-2]|nr:phage holin family protein [Oscillospiraceae bacterium MB08-C2-2]